MPDDLLDDPQATDDVKLSTLAKVGPYRSPESS